MIDLSMPLIIILFAKSKLNGFDLLLVLCATVTHCQCPPHAVVLHFSVSAQFRLPLSAFMCLKVFPEPCG